MLHSKVLVTTDIAHTFFLRNVSAYFLSSWILVHILGIGMAFHPNEFFDAWQVPSSNEIFSHRCCMHTWLPVVQKE